MANDQPPPEATTAPPPPASAPLTPPPFLSFLPFNQQISSPFWQQIPLPFPIVNLQPHSQINHGGVPYVAMPMADAQRGVVASRSASVPGIVQARKLLPPSSSAQLGGHVAVPSQASVAGMQLFAESPESTLLDPQTSPPPPSSGLHTSNLRPRPPQAETHVPSMRSSYHQQIYPPPLAAHQDVVADRRLFFSTLTKFHAFFETQLVIPKVEGDELDLHLLYCLVTANGGLEQVIKLKKWNHIFAAFGLPTRVLSQPYFFRKHYSNLLHHYEQVYFFRREGELVPPPVPLPSPNLLSPSQFHDQQLSYPVGENLEPVKKRRRKRFDRVEMLEADAGKLVGRVVNGAIDGKFEHGYLVTVHVGTEKLRGILYNVPVVNNTQQFAAVPELKNNVGVPASSSSFQVGLPRKRRGKVSKRDPNAPRLNRSGYNFFFAEQRSRLKHLGSENAEITRIIGDMWQRLTEQERMPYLLRGQSDKERYKKEKEDYHERGKLQLQQRQDIGFHRGFLESVHDIGHTPQELEEADQDSGDVNDTRHDYHVSLDADLDGGEMNLSQENNLQNQIYSLYVAGDHLNYGQEHAHYISGNTNHGQEPVDHGSEQTVPLQEDGHNAAAHMDDLHTHSQDISDNIVGSQDDK